MALFILFGLFFYRRGKRWRKKHRKLLLVSLILIAAVISTWPLKAFSNARKNLADKNTAALIKKTTATTTSTLSSEEEAARLAEEKTEKLESALTTAWQETLTGDETVQIAIYAPELSDKIVSYQTQGGTTPIDTASIVKVAIATEIYRKVDRNQLTLTNDDEIALRDMLEESDNDAATYLLRQRLADTSSLQELFTEVNMTHSTPKHSWGTTTTTAEDQVKLLQKVFYEDNFLSVESRNGLASHLENIASDQNWGISKGAVSFALKNGWLDLEDDRWVINSIGKVTLGTPNLQDYVVAILTDKNTTMEDGVALVEKLAETTSQVLSLQ